MQLLQVLQGIAKNIQIESANLRVNHSDFPPLEIPTATVVHLQKMPQKVQERCLNLQLQELVYKIYYDGSLARESSQGVNTNDQTLQKIFSEEVDWEFYEQLERSNQGKGWFHSDFQVLRQESDDSLAVQYDGLTLHVQRDRHLQLAEQSATIGELVSVWAPASYIMKDFYEAKGDATGNSGKLENTSNPAVFVYFNFSPTAAIAALECVTTKLNAIKVAFTFKVLHNPLNYGRRYDSGILRFDNDSYELVREVLQAIYSENKSYFQTHVPLFTKILAPGIGLAEHPHSELQFKRHQTFGWNRCQMVANALLQAHKNGDESSEARIKYILKHFENFGIDLKHPYLNPNAEDIYTPLD